MMFKAIVKCTECQKWFDDPRKRNIHWSQHCPYRLHPNKRAKLTHNNDQDTTRDGIDSEGDWEEAGDVEVGGNDEEELLVSQEIAVGEMVAQEESKRTRRLPARYQDHVVSSRSALVRSQASFNPSSMVIPEEPNFPAEVEPGQQQEADDEILPYIFYYQTEPDEFGAFKIYESSIPSIDPDENIGVDEVSDAPTFTSNDTVTDTRRTYAASLGVQLDNETGALITSSNDAAIPPPPFLNMSIFRLMHWYHDFTKPSLRMLDSLVKDVILSPDFKQSDFDRFSARTEVNRLDRYLAQSAVDEEDVEPVAQAPSNLFRDGWYTTSITIPLPRARQTFRSEDHAPKLTVDGLWYRRPLEVIKETLHDPLSANFHHQGHKLLWKRSLNAPVTR
ncbi:hypothetical protein VKT23_012158 [Stygiomarasmius scandens]|uniref:C2H2-type domain-containing protein n=1 Tax=Marasmiellus scandens TaxID=2682957 RepID=A0ABR1J736_9AGAR